MCSIAVTGTLSRQLDAIDFYALHPLSRGEADLLFRHQRRYARTPERARMNINIGAARLGNDKTESLLLVEKLYVAAAHRAARLASTTTAKWSWTAATTTAA